MFASTQTRERHGTVRVALVGNPNTGKTTLFNVLTGYRQRVGNYPGVTVEKKTGFLHEDTGAAGKIELVDLPGAYSLAAGSVDEAIVLDVLVDGRAGDCGPDLIVAVVDATNLARNLFLASQIVEIGKPVVIALNMIDLAEQAGLRIDADKISKHFNVPVIPIVATKGRGIERLSRAIRDSVGSSPPAHKHMLPECIRIELDGLRESLAKIGGEQDDRPTRVELLQVLLSPGGYHEARLLKLRGTSMLDELSARRERIVAAGESLTEVEARVRYASIERLLHGAISGARRRARSRSEAADVFLTHRLLGLFILILLMSACFQSIYTWAGPLMDAIDAGFSAVSTLVTKAIPAGALQSLISDGLVAGAGAVLVFLPQIMILFLFIAVLEDCGYMARVAFLLDRWMGMIGLNGKSFIPLLSSLACAVPGIMATRTIEDRRDRFVTIMIAPLMSCSARLPVYVLLIAAFIPNTHFVGGFVGLRAIVLLVMYCLGVGVAIVVALILKRTILKGSPQSFLMELPGYKWPSPKTVFYRMYEQGKAFCVSAGTIIFAVAIVVWALGYYPHSASVSAEHDAKRAAAATAHTNRMHVIATAFGISGDRDTRIDSGIESEAPPTEAALEIRRSENQLEQELAYIDKTEAGTYLRQSFLGRMGAWVEPVVKPLGWDWRIGTAAIASFPAREVVIATLGTIYNLGGGQAEGTASLREKLRSATWPDGRPVFNVAVALSIMVFFSLCCQCGATLATIRRETNSWRWPLFTFTYMTVLAYLGAFVTYQTAVRFV